MSRGKGARKKSTEKRDRIQERMRNREKQQRGGKPGDGWDEDDEDWDGSTCLD